MQLNAFQETAERIQCLSDGEIRFGYTSGGSATGRAMWGLFCTEPTAIIKGSLCSCDEVELSDRTWIRLRTVIMGPAPPQSQKDLDVTSQMVNKKLNAMSAHLAIEEEGFILATFLIRSREGYTDDGLRQVVRANKLLGLKLQDILKCVHQRTIDPDTAFLDFSNYCKSIE